MELKKERAETLSLSLLPKYRSQSLCLWRRYFRDTFRKSPPLPAFPIDETRARNYNIPDMEKVKKKTAATLLHIMKNSAVLWIALAAAGITCIFVPIDRGYLDYFDLRTLSCLFCTLAVVGAVQEYQIFRVARR